MKSPALSRALAVILAGALISLPETADACTVCMGDVNSKVAPAMNAAIFLMLGFIGFMLACAAAFGIVLMKRAGTTLSPHSEFSDLSNAPEDAA